jgi:hypothetical protein
MNSADRLTEVRACQPKAVHPALVVLEEVACCGPWVTARAMSENLGFPRATMYRLLNLLVQEECLVRLPDLSGFALGLKVVQLAGVSIPLRPPRQCATCSPGCAEACAGESTSCAATRRDWASPMPIPTFR